MSTLILRTRMVIWPNQQKFANTAGAVLIVTGIAAVGHFNLTIMSLTSLGHLKISAPPSMAIGYDPAWLDHFWIEALKPPTFLTPELASAQTISGFIISVLIVMAIFAAARFLLWRITVIAKKLTG